MMDVRGDLINVGQRCRNKRVDAYASFLRRDAISVSDDILEICMSALIDLDESGGNRRPFERRSDQIFKSQRMVMTPRGRLCASGKEDR